MPKRYDDSDIIKAVTSAPSWRVAAQQLNIDERSLRRRCKKMSARYDKQIRPLGIQQPQEAAAFTEITTLRERVKTLERTLARMSKEAASTEQLKRIFMEAIKYCPQPPEWLKKPDKHKQWNHGVPTLLLSDVHFDEIVYEDQVVGLNKYNRDIATKRLEHTFEKTVWLYTTVFRNAHYDGFVLALGGDMINGIIHEELREATDGRALESVFTLCDLLIAGIDHIRDTFGRVYIPCVVGNHGRVRERISYKNAVHDNFDWMLYMLLARHYRKTSDVTVHVPDSKEVRYAVYDTIYLLTHGDRMRGGAGISGPLTPWALGDHRMRRRAMLTHQPYDTLIFGHWHTAAWGPGDAWICNGCFPKGTGVITPQGRKPIETIKEGDEVLSGDGTVQKVTCTFSRRADRLVGFKVYGLPEAVFATPNHLVWAIKGSNGHKNIPPSRRHLIDKRDGPAQWIPADYLSPGDYVHVPFPKGNDEPIDEETAWAYGLFLAEGHTIVGGGEASAVNRIGITMHRNERDIVERFAQWFEKTYGIAGRIYHRQGHNTTDFVVHPGRDLCAHFRELLGHRAVYKHIPNGALYWSDALKAALIRGWMTGHSATQDDCRPTVSATTISPRLAWELFLIAPASGMWPALSKLRKGGNRLNDVYTVHFNVGQNVVVVDGLAFYQVKERYEGAGDFTVHDLEVSGEHTYVVEGVKVHNSMKGFDEYALEKTLPYERPQQVSWITHWEHGITFRAHIQCEPSVNPKPKAWVQLPS